MHSKAVHIFSTSIKHIKIENSRFLNFKYLYQFFFSDLSCIFWIYLLQIANKSVGFLKSNTAPALNNGTSRLNAKSLYRTEPSAEKANLQLGARGERRERKWVNCARANCLHLPKLGGGQRRTCPATWSSPENWARRPQEFGLCKRRHKLTSWCWDEINFKNLHQFLVQLGNSVLQLDRLVGHKSELGHIARWMSARVVVTQLGCEQRRRESN